MAVTSANRSAETRAGLVKSDCRRGRMGLKEEVAAIRHGHGEG